MGTKIKINRIIKQTRAEGFGVRYCIWVQGCSIRCPDCKNQHMWSFTDGEEVETKQVIQDIKSQTDIEGITLLGGEPLDQREAVADILKAAKEANLSTIVFTGYIYEDLVHGQDENTECILAHTDLLIDGPFKGNEKDFSRPWVGSNNQRYLFLSDRYCEKDLYGKHYENKYEMRIFPGGKVMVNGMGDLDKFHQILVFHGKEQKEE